MNENENENENENIPKKVFIVPYRNRLEHKFFFLRQMDFILENDYDYEIYFSHQCDIRPFNRGATKNIGFLAIKKKYPNNYKDITFIFNDIDTVPFHKIFDYKTTIGVVKHYYGFDYALGGIVVIKGSDFEKINGFPNFFSWGNEDSALQKRCLNNNIFIDRNQFYPIGSPEILQLFDGVKRLVTPRDYTLRINDSGYNGLKTINRLNYSIDKESFNPNDNKYSIENENINFINILSFTTGNNPENNDYYEYDLRDPTNQITNPNKEKTTKRDITKEEWKYINPVNTNNNTNNRVIKNINVFSPQYAGYLGVKPKATTNINIRLGGLI